MKIKLIISILSCLLLSVVCHGGDDLKLINLKSSSITELPEVNWIYHIDIKDNNIGIIEKDKKSFQLYDFENNQKFKLTAEGKNNFFLVSMKSPLILLGEVLESGKKCFSAYDYFGNLKLGQLYTDAVVEVDPSGRFFYSILDIGNDYNVPSLFNEQGELIAEFNSNNGNWDIKVINDSLILYRDDNIIKLLSYPELNVVKEIHTNVDRNSDIPNSCMNTTCMVYLFLNYSNIVVCDLLEEDIYNIPNKFINDIPTYPNFSISDDKKILTIFNSYQSSNYMSVYHKKNNNYEKLYEELIPLEPPNHFYRSEISKSGQFSIGNFFSKRNDQLVFSSYITNFFNSQLDEIKSKVVTGIAKSSGEMENNVIDVITLNNKQAVINKIEIDGGDHELNENK